MRGRMALWCVGSVGGLSVAQEGIRRASIAVHKKACVRFRYEFQMRECVLIEVHV